MGSWHTVKSESLSLNVFYPETLRILYFCVVKVPLLIIQDFTVF